MKGGPTLHEEDATLFTKGVLEKTHVYTLRRGEVVRKIDDTLMILEGEMIKIKGVGEAWSCIFYDDDEKACKIYQDRPVECRALMGLQQPGSDKAVEKILDLLQYDHYVRPFLTEKLNVDPNAMDFFFGRPLTTTIRRFGLCVKEEGDNFTLVPV
jgi:Fe-S-cluster containining protein